MRRYSVILGSLLLVSLALAQSVREVGMGGVSLPGPAQASKNPAFAAVEDTFKHSEWRLPLGLLGLLMPDRSPLYATIAPDIFYSNFDGLSAYDQLAHLDSFLINPERSPEEVVIQVAANGVRITDGTGKPLRLQFEHRTSFVAGRITPPPLFRIPFSLAPGFSAGISLFGGVEGAGVSPDAKLATLLAGGDLAPDETYAVTAEAHASSGISIDFGYADALPPVPELEGKLYGGVRGEVFYGLVRVDATLKGILKTNNQAKPEETTTETRVFYSYPGVGFGYGGRLDIGLAYATKQYVAGLGIQNVFGYQRWDGKEELYKDGSKSTSSASRVVTGFAPVVFLNGAGYVEVDEHSSVLLAADLGYAGSIAGHLGIEYPLGTTALRAGLGYENGLRFGVGAGFDLGGVALDLALTSHTGAFSGKQVFGVAASVGF